MTGVFAAAACLLLCAAAPLRAQFQLFVVNGNAELAVPAVFDLGTTSQTDPITRQFRVRNISLKTASLRLLEVAGSGFAVASPVSTPQNVDPGQAVEFSVVFRGAAEGSYSAALRSEGISVLLTASVIAQVTIVLETAAGTVPLPTGSTIQFGLVLLGSSGSARLRIENTTVRDQVIPALSVVGAEFRLADEPPAGLLHSLEAAVFELAFTPAASGQRSGTLLVGNRSFLLSGTGVAPPPPVPSLSLSPAQPRSGEQGTVSVRLSEKARTSASGTLTLEFLPQASGAADPTIVFANGTRKLSFSIAPGDERGPSIGFQTGTTAGVLRFTVQIGDGIDRQSIVIAPAPVVLAGVSAARTSSGLEVGIAGFDNSRSAGPLTFRFYDRSGTVIAPGAIYADSSADFASYFRSSDGGLFLLKARFPVTGDATNVAGVEVEVENAAGTARSARAAVQ